MFFTFAEKNGASFLSDSEWCVRMVAFDSSRRYLYYSDQLPTVTPSLQQSAAAPSPLRAGERGKAGVTPCRGTPEQEEDSIFHFDSSDRILKVNTQDVSPANVVWKQKIKVMSVDPVMTGVEFSTSDPHLHERDLFRLRIRGSVRPIAPGETPPLGPLLCESAEATPQPLRLSAGSDTFTEDPFQLKELYTSLHEQFDAINRERATLIAKAERDGKTPPVFPSQTIDSPRKSSSSSGSSSWFTKKTIVLRCREEREFRRLWYVLQTVLGYDKLIVRPYRGLPPFDPRNGICFAHIPIYAWHTFDSLDKAVFYTFTPGSLMHVRQPPEEVGQQRARPGSASSSAPSVIVSVSSAFLCVTHDMVLVMRSTGNIPCWVRLQDVRGLQYSLRASTPFVVFLTDDSAPDLVFVPQPPVYGPNAQRNFNRRHEVLRIAHVIHESWFAARGIRRVILTQEVLDEDLESYVQRLATERGTPLRTSITAGYLQSSAVSCPLPKEQLGAVWHQVQDDLRSRVERDPNGIAIPVYHTTAESQLQLRPDELTALQRQLVAGRAGQDDIVGVPLALIHQHSTRINTPSPGGEAGSGEQDPPAAAAADVGGVESGVLLMPLTAQLLHTPQLMGQSAGRMQRSQRKCHSLTTGSVTSERSGYYTTYANYIPMKASSTGGRRATADDAASVEERRVVGRSQERRVDELMELSLTAHRNALEKNKT